MKYVIKKRKSRLFSECYEIKPLDEDYFYTTMPEYNSRVETILFLKGIKIENDDERNIKQNLDEDTFKIIKKYCFNIRWHI